MLSDHIREMYIKKLTGFKIYTPKTLTNTELVQTHRLNVIIKKYTLIQHVTEKVMFLNLKKSKKRKIICDMIISKIIILSYI